MRLRERAPAHLAPRPGLGVHRSERDRGAPRLLRVLSPDRARERHLERGAAGQGQPEHRRSLQLALGTVKAHVHNILKKTGTTTRQELTQLFWKG